MKDAPSSGDSQQTPGAEDDDDDVIGCLPRLLLCLEAVSEGKQDTLENDLDRYARLLDIYQEQPNLLDCIIPSVLKCLESYITLPSSASPDKRLDQLSVTALRYIAHLTKVRGYKVIVRLLSHHVSYLDKLLTVLEQYKDNVGSDLYERHVLLLWLWIVCKNPFDFRRFDPADQPGSTTSRILAVATSYLKYPWSTVHPAAILVIAQCLARHDCIPLIPSIISECTDHLSHNSENHLNYAALLCAILKHVDRKYLLPHVSSVREAVVVHFPLKKSEKDSLTRKMFIKMVQRLALVVLKPRLAAWRYKRGRRRLEENLKSPTANGNSIVSNQACFNNSDLGADDICMEEDEDEHPDDVVEWAIGCVLCALSDDHTTVRWSAAKGVGRITARLPKELAVQVVDSILSSNFHRLAGHCSWHGGCLALAELSRRGFLLPEALDKAFPIVQQALFYEEPMGRHAFGSNVRDAACYVLWAFARAYEPEQLTTFIDSVATSLMCVTLFDREVNLRRAASAAFQENVGRQANFPDGIALLTTVDYFIVGNRWRCYTKACLEVVRYPKYADAMIDHLVTHWDETIREQAAIALGLLAPLHSEYLSRKLGFLLDGCGSSNPIHRHGYLLALAHCIQGLVSAGFPCSKEILFHAVELPWKLRAESEKLKVSGGEVTRLALATFIRCLSSVPIALDPEKIEKWLDRLLMFACDDTATVRLAAAAAASTFFPAYFLERVSERIDERIESIPSKILSARRENERIGLCLVIAYLPRRFISSLLLDAICNVIIKRNSLDAKWALARRSAVDALGEVFASRPCAEWISPVFDALFCAVDDYTTDCHGDIGRFVRMSAMCVMTKVLSLPCLEDAVVEQYTQRVVQHMVQQSVGKIGRIRETACKCIKTLLYSKVTRQHISHADELSVIYRDEHDFIQDSVFLSITPLLLCEEYYTDLICGLVISAGGVSEGTTMRASQALMEYQLSTSKNLKMMERFLETVADLFDVGRKVTRIGDSVLRLLPQILSRLHVLEQCPDSSVALSRLLIHLTKIVNSRTVSPSRIKCALNSLCSLLGCNRDSLTWRTAMQLVVRSLSSNLPVVRRAAAEGLYENVCLTDVDDQVSVRWASEKSQAVMIQDFQNFMYWINFTQKRAF
ncbi:HEAT repeat protein [Cooperia oncophora]